MNLGAKKDTRDRRDYRVAGVIQSVDIPSQKFIISDKFPHKNQGNRGSCTAQASAHHKERQEQVMCSAEFIMAKSKTEEGNKSYGGYLRNAFKVIKNFGVCVEKLLPEPDNSVNWENYIDENRIKPAALKDALKHRSQSYWRVNNSINDIRNILTSTNNSICMSMDWHKEFNTPDRDGLLPEYFGAGVGGHAVDIIGFDDAAEVLIVKNSWGDTWGKNGNFKLPYDMFYRVVWDLWCSLDIPEVVPVDERYGINRTWDTFLLEKSMAFNAWLIKKIKRLPNNREISGLAYGRWEYEAVFLAKYGDVWLYHTKPEARELKLI